MARRTSSVGGAVLLDGSTESFVLFLTTKATSAYQCGTFCRVGVL